MSSVGSSVAHESSELHVQGQALYIDDFPKLSGELVIGYLGSPIAHGKIIKLDVSEALKVEGLVAVYTYKDVPGSNHYGAIFHDEELLAEETVYYIGQPIVAFLAKDLATIAKAKTKVHLEIDELETIFTIDDAIAKKSYLAVERKIQAGDVKKGFAKADHIIEGIFYSGGQEHFYFENQAALAIPNEKNQLTVYTSTQNPTEIQKLIAEVLALGHHQVVAICKRMGGAFGGKETQGVLPALLVSLATLKTKKPVRCVYDKDFDMKVTGKRHAYKSDYKIGFRNDGKITAYEVQFYSNGGAACDLSTSVLERTMLHAENCYYIKNISLTAKICKTNLPPNTAFRGFGGPQGIAVIENAIQEIAITLNKNSLDIQKLNCYKNNSENITPYGQLITNNVLPELLEELEKQSKFQERLRDIEKFNHNNIAKLRGIALAPVKFGISFTTKHLNQGNALVNLYSDGTIQVSTGGTEMGQGLYTKIRQIVADEFAIDLENVIVMQTSTEKNANSSPTAASAGCDLNGNAAVVACEKIRSNLAHFAADYFSSKADGLIASLADICFHNNFIYDKRIPDKKVAFKKMVDLAYHDRINLCERGFFRTPGVDFNRETGRGNPFFYFTNGAAVCEVEIDLFTGENSIRQLDCLLDFGKSINPSIDRGQAIGGLMQGIGWATIEELRYSNKGELLTHSPTTYKIPGINNFPEKCNLKFYDNKKHTINVRSSKAVAEPPFCLGIAAFSALKHALSFIKPQTVFSLTLPATGEEILKRISLLQQHEKLSSEEDYEIQIITAN